MFLRSYRWLIVAIAVGAASVTGCNEPSAPVDKQTSAEQSQRTANEQDAEDKAAEKKATEKEAEIE